MNAAASNLTEKIQSLTDEQIVEVEDFVEFVRLHRGEPSFTHVASTISAPAFEAVWDNPEDAAYDAL
jgi:uncharacterized membrane protein